MGVATKVMTLNACTPLKSSQSVVVDTSPLVIEKSGRSQGFCFSFSVATMSVYLYMFRGLFFLLTFMMGYPLYVPKEQYDIQ